MYILAEASQSEIYPVAAKMNAHLSKQKQKNTHTEWSELNLADSCNIRVMLFMMSSTFFTGVMVKPYHLVCIQVICIYTFLQWYILWAVVVSLFYVQQSKKKYFTTKSRFLHSIGC